jgi:hypothetical protein
MCAMLGMSRAIASWNPVKYRAVDFCNSRAPLLLFERLQERAQ